MCQKLLPLSQVKTILKLFSPCIILTYRYERQQMHIKGLKTVRKFQKIVHVLMPHHHPQGSQTQRWTSTNTSVLEVQYQILDVKKCRNHKIRYGLVLRQFLFTTIRFYNPCRVRPSTPDSWRIGRNSGILCLLGALLALFRCARVPSFSILVQFF